MPPSESFKISEGGDFLMKKAFVLLLVFSLIVGASFTTSFAVEIQDFEKPEPMVPDYVTVLNNEISLAKLNSKALITVRIEAISGAQFRNGTLKLYKYENSTWTSVKTWKNLSASTSTFSFNDNSIAVQSGTRYKVKISITAYTSSTSEKIVLDMTKEL